MLREALALHLRPFGSLERAIWLVQREQRVRNLRNAQDIARRGWLRLLLRRLQLGRLRRQRQRLLLLLLLRRLLLRRKMVVQRLRLLQLW